MLCTPGGPCARQRGLWRVTVVQSGPLFCALDLLGKRRVGERVGILATFSFSGFGSSGTRGWKEDFCFLGCSEGGFFFVYMHWSGYLLLCLLGAAGRVVEGMSSVF